MERNSNEQEIEPIFSPQSLNVMSWVNATRIFGKVRNGIPCTFWWTLEELITSWIGSG